MIKGFQIIIWLAALSLFISACTAPVTPLIERDKTGTPPDDAAGIMPVVPTDTSVVPTSPTVLATRTPEIPTSTPPAADETATPPTSAIIQPDASAFVYEGVQFVLPPAVATSASGEIVPENPATSDGPYWDIHPRYIRVSLQGYPLAQSFFQPEISVYPRDAYHDLSDIATKKLDDLDLLLTQKPADADQLPFLPIVNAGQTFHSNVQYLDFQNGSGVRYLAIYAQYPAPVNSYDLFYTFQGLTTDGRHAISIILPVSHPSLPANPDAVTQTEMEANINNPAYYPDMAATLTAQPASSFTPDLTILDNLIASLFVE